MIQVVALTDELVPAGAALLALHLPTDPASATDLLQRLLAWPSAQFFLAAHDGAWAGFISTHWGFSTRTGRPIVRVQDLFTHPDYRRSGIARALLAHAAELGCRHGAGRLELVTDTENAPARALYEALGFEWFGDKEVYMRFL